MTRAKSYSRNQRSTIYIFTFGVGMKKILLLALLIPSLIVSQISITSSAFSYNQNFNGLANSGTGNVWTDNSTIIGWYSNRTTYNASTGSSTTGSLYSYGSTSSTERSLGSLASGTSGTIVYGIRFINNSGITITSIPIEYVGEQWRNSTETAHKLDFQYQINATGINTGTWVDVNELDFICPITGGTVGALDGNNSSNRLTISYEISIVLLDNQEIWFRWVDIDDSGNDHGLGIDDFYFNKLELPLPVELTIFKALVEKEKVKLNWSTATEVNNYGFEIERKCSNGDWKKIGFVQGHGNSNSPKNYTYSDQPLGDVTFKYRLKQIDFDGTYDYSPEVTVKLDDVKQFVLEQNYPNPFNPATTIRFSLPVATEVSISVFNLLGERVAQILNSNLNEGYHEVTFDGSSLTSGIYFYQLRAGDFKATKKFIITK